MVSDVSRILPKDSLMVRASTGISTARYRVNLTGKPAQITAATRLGGRTGIRGVNNIGTMVSCSRRLTSLRTAPDFMSYIVRSMSMLLKSLSNAHPIARLASSIRKWPKHHSVITARRLNGDIRVYPSKITSALKTSASPSSRMTPIERSK